MQRISLHDLTGLFCLETLGLRACMHMQGQLISVRIQARY
jgi:hypothetical protein